MADNSQDPFPVPREPAVHSFGLIVTIGCGLDSHSYFVLTCWNSDRGGLATFHSSEHKRATLDLAVQWMGVDQTIVQPD